MDRWGIAGSAGLQETPLPSVWKVECAGSGQAGRRVKGNWSVRPDSSGLQKYIYIFSYIILFTYLSLTFLGLHYCVGFSLVAMKRASPAAAPLAAEHST